MNMRAEETFSGIYANAFAATEWLSTGAYADVVSGSAMRTSDILRPDTIVFVQIPLRTLLVTPAVGRATMGALFNAMFHADGDVGRRILFEIDEAWVLGRLKEIMLVPHDSPEIPRCSQHYLAIGEAARGSMGQGRGRRTARYAVLAFLQWDPRRPGC